MEVSAADGGSSGETGGSGGSRGSRGGGGSSRLPSYLSVTYELQPEAPFQYVWPSSTNGLLQLLATSQHLLLLRILPAHVHGVETAGQASDPDHRKMMETRTAGPLESIEQWAANIIDVTDYTLRELTGQRLAAPEKQWLAALNNFKQELLQAREGAASGIPLPQRLLDTAIRSEQFPILVHDVILSACASISVPLKQIEPAVHLTLSGDRALLPSTAEPLQNCLIYTSLLLRLLAVAERHGTLHGRWVFSLGGKSAMQSCSVLVSRVATVLAPACLLLGSEIQLWLSSPHLSPQARQCVSAAVSHLTVCTISKLTAAVASLAARCTLQDFGSNGCSSSSAPASTTAARLRTRLSARRVLADANGVSSHSSSTVGGIDSDAVAADRAAAALLEQEQREQQAQQARAAAKAAKRQRQKQRKAAEAAAAAAVAAAVPEQQDSAAELPVTAGAPSDAAAAGGESAQPAGCSPAAPVRPAASGLDQLELLLAQLGLGGADFACDEEGQGEGSGEGSGGTCLLAFPTGPPVQPSTSSSSTTTTSASSPEQSIESLLAQLGVGGSAAGSRPSSASGWASPAVSSSAAGAAAAAHPAPTADDDSLDALLVQLGVGSYSAEAVSAAATGTSAHSAAAPAPAASLPTAATPASGLDPALLASLECPLTLQAMRQPVVAADGNTYERAAIAAWIARQQTAGRVPRSPLTNQPLGDLSLRPNHALASLITGLRAGGQLGGGRTVGRQHGTALATGLS